MEERKLCDGLELSSADDMEYVCAYHRKGSTDSGIAMKTSGLGMMGLTVTAVVNVLQELREPLIQSMFFKVMFDTIKHEKVLNPLVDLAVSYDGKVLRDENEEAADHCE